MTGLGRLESICQNKQRGKGSRREKKENTDVESVFIDEFQPPTLHVREQLFQLQLRISCSSTVGVD